MVKNLSANAGEAGDKSSTPGLGRSPGGGRYIPVSLPGKSHEPEGYVGFLYDVLHFLLSPHWQNL